MVKVCLQYLYSIYNFLYDLQMCTTQGSDHNRIKKRSLIYAHTSTLCLFFQILWIQYNAMATSITKPSASQSQEDYRGGEFLFQSTKRKFGYLWASYTSIQILTLQYSITGVFTNHITIHYYTLLTIQLMETCKIIDKKIRHSILWRIHWCGLTTSIFLCIYPSTYHVRYFSLSLEASRKKCTQGSFTYQHKGTHSPYHWEHLSKALWVVYLSNIIYFNSILGVLYQLSLLNKRFALSRHNHISS